MENGEVKAIIFSVRQIESSDFQTGDQTNTIIYSFNDLSSAVLCKSVHGVTTALGRSVNFIITDEWGYKVIKVHTVICAFNLHILMITNR